MFKLNFNNRILAALIFVISWLPVKSSDIIYVYALNSQIIVLHFDDGYVEYHKRGESRQKDRVVHQPLDITEAVKTENYFIKSTEGY